MFVFVILSCLFLAALWLPAGKGLTSWLSCVFVTFPYGVLGQVCYVVVLIPDLCLHPYFYKSALEKILLILYAFNSGPNHPAHTNKAYYEFCSSVCGLLHFLIKVNVLKFQVLFSSQTQC